MLYDLVRQGRNEPELRLALFKHERDEQPYVAMWQRQLNRLEAPWLRFFLSYNPATALEKVKCPVLALQGEKDTQVIADQNVPAMKAALARGGNRDFEVDLLPGLNYMFQNADTGLGWEYETIPQTISPAVLEKVGNWISKRTS